MSKKIRRTYTFFPETISWIEAIKNKERLPSSNYAVEKAIALYAEHLGIEAIPQPKSKANSSPTITQPKQLPPAPQNEILNCDEEVF